uniref:Uncharacterized protein n=1 Tax=Salix viminalis TaxID=40686 RepID=A0A6N2M7T9_SALVM
MPSVHHLRPPPSGICLSKDSVSRTITLTTPVVVLNNLEHACTVSEIEKGKRGTSDLDNEPLVKLVGGECVETFGAHDVIGRLMIQCALQHLFRVISYLARSGKIYWGLRMQDRATGSMGCALNQQNFTCLIRKRFFFYEIVIRVRQRKEIATGHRLANAELAIINPPEEAQHRKWSLVMFLLSSPRVSEDLQAAFPCQVLSAIHFTLQSHRNSLLCCLMGAWLIAALKSST